MRKFVREFVAAIKVFNVVFVWMASTRRSFLHTKGKLCDAYLQSSVIAVLVKCVQVKQLHWRHGSPRMSHSDGIDNHEHMFAGSHSSVMSFFRCPTRDNKVCPQHMSAAMQFNKIVYRRCVACAFYLFNQKWNERQLTFICPQTTETLSITTPPSPNFLLSRWEARQKNAWQIDMKNIIKQLENILVQINWAHNLNLII